MRLRWPAISACYRGRYYPTWSIQPPNLPRLYLKQKGRLANVYPKKCYQNIFRNFFGLWRTDC